MPALLLCAACGSGEAVERAGGETMAGGSGAVGVPGPADVAGATALILCAQDTHDFGSAWEGSILSHEFEFVAGGEAELSIVNIKPDCGCTVADLDIMHADGSREKYEFRTPVPAGTRFALGAQFNTHGRQGSTPKRIRVYGNVPGGAATMTIQARVKPFLVIQPAKIQAMGRISVLDTATREFTVSSVGGERYKLEPTRRALPPEAQVLTEPLDPDDQGRATAWKVTVLVGPGMPKGTRTYPLDLQTDLENPHGALQADGRRARFVITPSINVMVVGAVSALPQNISFGVMRADQTVAKTLRVECYDPGFRLPEPRIDVQRIRDGESMAFTETLKITTREIEGENAWEVEILLEGLSANVGRSFLGRLAIETGHPDEPRVEVTLSGLKQGR